MTYEKLVDINGDYIFGENEKSLWVYGDGEPEKNKNWRTTITIYNKRIDKTLKTVKWYSTTIENCFWASVDGYTHRGGGTQSFNPNSRDNHYEDTFIVRIPYDNRYRTPKQWAVTPDGFTARPGDLVFKGMVHINIGDTLTENEALNIYAPECFVIQNASDNMEKSDYIKHVRVNGH